MVAADGPSHQTFRSTMLRVSSSAASTPGSSASATDTVHYMNGMTTAKLLQCLNGIFAAYGYPKELVSDNGP